MWFVGSVLKLLHLGRMGASTSRPLGSFDTIVVIFDSFFASWYDEFSRFILYIFCPDMKSVIPLRSPGFFQWEMEFRDNNLDPAGLAASGLLFGPLLRREVGEMRHAAASHADGLYSDSPSQALCSPPSVSHLCSPSPMWKSRLFHDTRSISHLIYPTLTWTTVLE